MTPQEKVKATFEVDKQTWQDFVGYSRLVHHSTASELLRKYIEDTVRQDSRGVKERKA